MLTFKIKKDRIGVRFINAYYGRGDALAKRAVEGQAGQALKGDDPFLRSYRGEFQKMVAELARTISGSTSSASGNTVQVRRGRLGDRVSWIELSRTVYNFRMAYFKEKLSNVFPHKDTYGLGRTNPWRSEPHERGLDKGMGPFFRVEQERKKYVPWSESLSVEDAYRTQSSNTPGYKENNPSRIVVVRGRLQSTAHHAGTLMEGRKSFIMPNTTFKLDKDRTVWMVFEGRNGEAVFIPTPPAASRFEYIRTAQKQNKKKKKGPSLRGIQGSFILRKAIGPNADLMQAFNDIGVDAPDSTFTELDRQTKKLIEDEAHRHLRLYLKKTMGV